MDDDAALTNNNRSNSLRKRCIVGGPVTCVSLPCEAYCWVAKGCFLERYSLLDGLPSSRHLVFPDGGTVHGLRSHGNNLVVFGGRKVAVYEMSGETLTKQGLRLGDREESYILASDWIWDLRIASSSKQDSVAVRLAFGLANNACEIWIVQSDLSAQRTHKIKGAATCITYSMSFHGWQDNCADLILASGTVFHHILIWTVMEADSGHQHGVSAREETYRLTGHQGVILSLQFAEDGASLASTSDDRSVRLWKYSDNHWQCSWVGWGHSARVWSVAFSSMGLISTAEDASAKIWDLERGSQIGEIRSYSCQSLWKVAVYKNWALIGGNDGSAKLYDLRSKVERRVNHDDTEKALTKTVMVPDDRPLLSFAIIESKDTPPGKGKKSKTKVDTQVVFGMVFFYLKGAPCLLTTTRSGSTFVLSIKDLTWSEISPWWTATSEGIQASDGSCIAIHEETNSLIVGTSRGEVVLSPLFNERNQRRLTGSARYYKSVHTVSWLDPHRFLTMHIKGFLLLWHISLENKLYPTRAFNTALPGIPTCCCIDRSNHLLVGDSRGNLAIFNLDGQEAENMEILPLAVGSKFHKKEHVNVLLYHKHRLWSVGNDGYINESTWSIENGLQRSLSRPCSTLSGLTHMWINDNSVVVAGYHGNLFIALDTATGYEIFRVDTGGRQRNLACFLRSGSFGVGVCISKKDGMNEILLHTHVHRGDDNVTWRRNFGPTLHGEPIFDVSLFSSKPGARYAMLLTGSEDCTSKILVIEDALVINSFVIPAQESCIRAVSTSRHKDTSSTLICICGGKLVVQFYLLIDNTDTIQSTPLMDLTISFLQVGCFPFTSSIDHRINAVSSLPLESNDGNCWHVVATGDSNGSIHLFLVSENLKQRSALMGFLLVGCLRTVLTLHILRIKRRLLLFAGSTGGDVTIWDLPGSQEQYKNITSAGYCPVASYHAHQSGTNAIDAKVVSSDATSTHVCVCSGGDDQAITISYGVCSLEKGGNVSFDLKTVHSTKEASRSAIKGVALTSDNTALSVGYSQRLALWRIKDSCEITLISSTAIDVSDVNCLSTCISNSSLFAAIGGEGIELQQLSIQK